MKITKLDFLNKVDRHSCKGRVVKEGKAKEGHENCGSCQGNYLHDGECNFGGEHTIKHDLEIINLNFNRFNLLLEGQYNLDKTVSEKDFNQQKEQLINDYNYLIRSCERDTLEFFKGTCISIESKQHVFLETVKQNLRIQARMIKFFVEEVKNLDWLKLKSYRDKTEKLEKLIKQAAQTTIDYKEAVERGDTAEANRLLILLKEQQSTIVSLQTEIKKDPVDNLLGEKTREVFNNVIGGIWGTKKNISD
jgi:hypothetical protein